MTLSKKNAPTDKNGDVGVLRSVGQVHSSIRTRSEAPRQGSEGAPDAWLEIDGFAVQGLDGLNVGDEVIVLTWLHQASRNTLKVHPRGQKHNPLTGVFATRSPDRPNPIGLHQVTIRKIDNHRLLVGPIEVIDGTPVIDIKPVLC